MDFDPKKDYYKTLGIAEDASDDDIKKAFRKLAVQHHPDKGGDKAKFQEANEAHQVLSDAKKRQQYDAYRKGGFGEGGAGFNGFGGFNGGDFDFGGVDLGDLMGDLFGGGSARKRGRQQGEDVQIGLVLSFEDAFLGVTKTVQYTRKIIASNVKTETCSACGGRGHTIQQARTPFGVMQTQAACRSCQGTGTIYTKDGKKISDGGLEATKETIDIKVPAGIKDGVFIKFTDKGDEGFGNAPAGSLYVKIQIKKSDVYQRKDRDLYVQSDVSLFDLVLGGEITVPHPEGSFKVKVPKGTQIDSKIKITGKGFGEKGIFGSRGDMYIIPFLTIPKKLSAKEEKLWKELKDLGE